MDVVNLKKNKKAIVWVYSIHVGHVDIVVYRMKKLFILKIYGSVK